MKAHELAKLLLSGPDLEVATHANNHNAVPYLTRHGSFEGGVRVARMVSGGLPYVLIGNFTKRDMCNTQIVAELDGGAELPDQW